MIICQIKKKEVKKENNQVDDRGLQRSNLVFWKLEEMIFFHIIISSLWRARTSIMITTLGLGKFS